MLSYADPLAPLSGVLSPHILRGTTGYLVLDWTRGVSSIVYYVDI